MKIAIDATNIGGGGGITHLKEILLNFDKTNNKGIERIIIFSSQKILNQLPDYDIIEKITFPMLNKGLIHRIIFQIFCFDKHLINKVDILFSITGDYIGRFKPIIGMSRNMLLYERDIWKEIKQPKEIIRFWLNFQKQKISFNNSSGIIFISKYAQELISKQLNLKSKKIKVIHHGVSLKFANELKHQKKICQFSIDNPFRLLYISTIHVYKHQWNVVEAVSNLRKKGYPIELNLIGGVIFKPAWKKLKAMMKKVDPLQAYIHYFGHISYEKIDEYYKTADGFIFASTCENMPNILIESMSSGIPIACSNKDPMPEFLKQNGFYFNAKSVESIELVIQQFLLQPKKREEMARNCLKEVQKYSWKKTSLETFQFLEKVYKG